MKQTFPFFFFYDERKGEKGTTVGKIKNDV